MYLSDAVRERIKFYQKKNGMSLWALFKASGVPISTLAVGFIFAFRERTC